MESEDPHAAQAPSRIVVADDHPLFRTAIRHTLEGHPDLEVVSEAADGRQALEMCRRFRPHLVLMDLRMPVMDGVAATRAIMRELPATRVLVLTAVDESRGLSDSLKAGASGYVLKGAPPEEITDAIRRVLSGVSTLDQELAMRLLRSLIDGGEQGESAGSDPEALLGRGTGPPPVGPLSPREVEVLRLVMQGKTNRQIAGNLSISVSTVKRHVHHISAKLGVCDRVQAAVRAVELGLLDRRGRA